MRTSEEPHEAVKLLAEGGLRDRPARAWSLVDSAWSALQRFVLHRLLHKDLPRYLIEDCGQTVLERVWKYRQTYRGRTEGELWSWVRRICDNERKRLCGKERKQPISETALLDRSNRSGEGSLEQEQQAAAASATHRAATRTAEEKEVRSALKQCLSELKGKHGVVISLLYAGAALTERGVAEILTCSPSFVHKLKKQALELLRKCLEKKGVD